MYFQNRLCITKNSKIKQKILQEAHSSRYSIHPSSNKIYGDLEQMYWWLRMKGEISECVKMSNFSTESITIWDVTACYDTRVEIETGYHGFHIKVTIKYEKERCQLWFVCLNLNISYLYILIVHSRSWQSYMWLKLLDFMKCHCLLFLIEINDLLLDFGVNYTKV
ncbi:gag-pol polyprotein [Gossypium australe]|uniref:Gag-pol polyprotein n=1 Tax=Gossypium australe TaxID=47621 RepID=A0A5B6W4S9_9ROSI|nr:gag-pol polyprotein [Gossypium australe]